MPRKRPGIVRKGVKEGQRAASWPNQYILKVQRTARFQTGDGLSLSRVQTYYRQPSKAPAYRPRGKGQLRALQSARANTPTRVVATLNGYTGRILYLQQSKIGKEDLTRFLAQIRTAYPNARKIYIVQDHWPVHGGSVGAASIHQSLTEAPS